MTATTTQPNTTWSLTDRQMSIMLLRGLLKSGRPPREAFQDMVAMQPKRSMFWTLGALHLERGGHMADYFAAQQWPASIVAAIQIGEHNGCLNASLQGVEESLENQSEVRELLSGLIKPAILLVIGLIVCFLFLRWVLPSLLGDMHFRGRQPGIVLFIKGFNAWIDNYGLIFAGIVAALIAYLVACWRSDSRFRCAILDMITALPVLGENLKWLSFAIWAKHVSIMLSSSGKPDAILDKTTEVLPENFHNAIRFTAREVSSGQTWGNAFTPTSPNDPRNVIPLHVINACRMYDLTGRGADQMLLAYDAMNGYAKKRIAKSINWLTEFASLATVVIAMTPYGMYLMSMGAVATAAN